jgi:dephospho-CoA kinase
MKIIGLTGGISTGKSTVSHFISTLRVPVLDADIVARQVVVPGQVCYHLILDHFGVDILDENSQINRAALGSIIFNNTEERIALNSITHPRIRIELLKQVLYQFLIGKSMVVLDTPLLFEAGFYRWVHSTIVVYCPVHVQMERLMARDGIPHNQAKQKMDSQMSIEQKKSLAHYVIDNTGRLEETRKQTERLVADLTPSSLSVVMMWMLFFWPALLLYGFLKAYTVVDTWRHVGVFSHRPIPVKVGSIAPTAQ